MTDFNFLRIKWPKLAAIAADASRLVEVSPSSAISTMQNFCEWAADIALDLNDINTQNGITQQEKIETLKAIGHAPADIIGRFQNVMLAGGRRLYRQNEDVEEARMCIEDVYEIGRWLNKEADRAGWPPKSDYYRPMVTPLGTPPDGGAYSPEGGIGEKLKNYQPLLLIGVGAIVVIAIAVFLIIAVTGGLSPANAKPTIPAITPTPTLTVTPDLLTEPGDIATPTPVPEVYKFINDPSIKIKGSQNTFFLGKWKFDRGDEQFTIGDKHYENGLGMYMASKTIQKKQGTMTLTCTLDDEYDKVMFDLGVDSNLQYGAGYGKFRVQIYCDSTSGSPVYDSNLKEYDYTELGVSVNISGCKKLLIKLTEQKGTKGTINVVLGDMRLVKGGVPAGTSGSASSSASSSASASASASSSASASASPTPTSTGSAEGEQDNPPG